MVNKSIPRVPYYYKLMATFRLDFEYEIEYNYDFSIPYRMLRLSRTTPIPFLEPHSLLISNMEERGL